MKKGNKHNVFEVYNKIIDWFDSHRNKDLKFESAYLDLISENIESGSSILDVGCGTGEPIAKYFLEQGYNVRGIDASEEMIKRCKERFPSGDWLQADMRELNLTEQYDLVIVWHSLFHLPHDDQRTTLKKLTTYVKNNGLLVFTSGPECSEDWSQNGGYDLYQASLSAEEYKQILTENKMTVLTHKIKDPDCGGATVWVAQRRHENNSNQCKDDS
jgi:ubiquinone/menaquinone biosynthesis C-methylase UbiE